MFYFRIIYIIINFHTAFIGPIRCLLKAGVTL